MDGKLFRESRKKMVVGKQGKGGGVANEQKMGTKNRYEGDN